MLENPGRRSGTPPLLSALRAIGLELRPFSPRACRDPPDHHLLLSNLTTGWTLSPQKNKLVQTMRSTDEVQSSEGSRQRKNKPKSPSIGRSQRRTRSSAITEWPRGASCHSVSSNLANYHATVQKLLIRQVLTKPMVWSWRFSWGQCVINKLTTIELCISPVYRRLAAVKLSKSTT